MNVEDTIRDVLENQCSACCMDNDGDREFTVRELTDALREHIAGKLAELLDLEEEYIGLGADGEPVWNEVDQDWMVPVVRPIERIDGDPEARVKTTAECVGTMADVLSGKKKELF